MNNRIKELLSNTLLFTIANLGSKVLVFLMIPLYTAVLSTEEYGISDMVHTTAQMLFPILSCMIADGVLRFCFIKEIDNRKVLSIGVRITAIGICICIIVTTIFVFIPIFQSLGLYIWFIPLLFCNQSCIQLLHKFSRGIGKVRVSAFAGLFGSAIVVALNLFFLLVLKLGVLGFLLAYYFADVIAIIYMCRQCHVWDYWTNDIDVNLRKQMLDYSFPLVPNQISWWALSSINRYIMLAWLGISSVGIYSATLRIPTILTVLSDIFAQAWLLSALKNYGSEESKRFIKVMYSRYWSLLIVMTSVIILLSCPLANLLLSNEFSSYWWISPYLFISVFWGAMIGFLGSIFSAERKNTIQFVSTVLGAVVSVIVTLLFIKQYGVIVVPIATMVGYFVIWIVRRTAVDKYLQIGVGTLYSIFQGFILLIESVFVNEELYTYAIICVLILALMNIKNMKQILNFGYNSAASIVKSKIK